MDSTTSTTPPPPPFSFSLRKRILLGAILLAIVLATIISIIIGSNTVGPVKDVLPPVSNKTISSDTPTATTAVLLHPRRIPILFSTVMSAGRVVFTVLLPIILFSVFVVYLLSAPYSVISMPTKVITGIGALFTFLLVVFNYGFPSMDALMELGDESAVEAMRFGNVNYFVKNPIEQMQPAVFGALLLAYLEESVLYLRGGKSVVEQDTAVNVNLVGSIGLDLLFYTDSQYRAASEVSEDDIELAGRSKSDNSSRVSNRTITAFSDWSPWHRLGIHLEQYGDDTIGVNTGNRLYVVADGVSGSDNPEHARYASLALVLACLKRLAVDSTSTIFETIEPLLLQLVSFMHTVNCNGSSTLTVAQIVNGELLVAQLGDSTCMVTRKDQIVFHTNPTTHAFNCPYQFSREWESHFAPLHYYRFKLQPGDRIYLYSDGVGDNLWPKDVLKLKTAGRIAAKAVQVFTEELTADIPFNDRLMSGSIRGKRDDVSVMTFTFT